MRPGPASISKIITSIINLDAHPRPVVDLITDIILTEGWEENQTMAIEKAENWEANVLKRLEYERNELLEIGHPPRYTFNSSSSYMIQGSCFIEPIDLPEVIESKTKRLRSDDYYNAILDISTIQFEQLCGRIIELLGVEKPVVTRRTSDEGIDFYGKLSLESIFYPRDLYPTIQKHLSIWLVGQAKQYIKLQPSTQEIRELVGSVMLARTNVFGSLNHPYRNLNIRVSDPIFTILISTSSFSANALRLLKRSGVIGMDGNMVAAFLADREVGLIDGHFDKNCFVNWIEG
jgi:hypothetical protein